MRKSIFILALLAIAFGAKSQGIDPEFSLYNYQPLTINPALAGNSEAKWRLNLTAREQNYVISQPYRSGVASFDINLPINAWAGNIWGLGFNVVHDDQGDVRLKNTRYNVSLSVGQYLDPRQQHSLSVGFQGGLGQRAIDYSSVYWDNQWVGEGFALYLPSGENLPSDVKSYFDLSTGIQYSYDGDLADVTLGYGMFHANTPDHSLYIDSATFDLDRRHSIHFSMEHRLRKDNLFALRPSFLITRQGKTNNVIFGNDFVFYFNEPTRTTGKRKEYSMSLGMFHRLQKDLIASMMFNLAGFSFGTSYDVSVGNINKLNGYQGAWEVFIGYKAGFRKGSNSRYMPHKKGRL